MFYFSIHRSFPGYRLWREDAWEPHELCISNLLLLLLLLRTDRNCCDMYTLDIWRPQEAAVLVVRTSFPTSPPIHTRRRPLFW